MTILYSSEFIDHQIHIFSIASHEILLSVTSAYHICLPNLTLTRARFLKTSINLTQG